MPRLLLSLLSLLSDPLLRRLPSLPLLHRLLWLLSDLWLHRLPSDPLLHRLPSLLLLLSDLSDHHHLDTLSDPEAR